MAQLTFRGGKRWRRKRTSSCLEVMCEKLLPTKDAGYFFTFLLLSRISLPLDLLPTSACNISECWVRLRAETHCSLNNAIACPLTGNRHYASPDDYFFSAAKWICMQLGLFHLRGVNVCALMYALNHMCASVEICWKLNVRENLLFVVLLCMSLSLYMCKCTRILVFRINWT